MRALFACVAVAVGIATVRAGTRGSLPRGDIADLLASDYPQMKRVIADFEIACVGDARMINRSESIKLNGLRIGPYDFPVRPKGSAQPFCYTAHIETKSTFVDVSGHTVPLGKATDVREVVTGVSLVPTRPDGCFVQRIDQCD